jgi:hypothetical protein
MAYSYVPGALYGAPAPVRWNPSGSLKSGPPVAMWTDRGQAMFLLAWYVLLGIVSLYLAARPTAKKRQ